MSVIQTCFDTKDVLDLFRPQSLYLKPISRLNVSVQLPQLKKSGAKISNWEVMERIKEMAKPFTFPVFKVAKSSLEFIRFEAEIENFGSVEQILAKLDMKTIKLSGFHELLKVRAAEAKIPFPTRQEWDSYFRENKAMNEMKAGERPDTIHIQNLPTKWFVNHQDKTGASRDRPSEFVLKKVFGAFGEIRAVDIPMLDPYREKMKSSISGIQTFAFGQDLVFEAYIQYKEYIGFVKGMNSLKGMKLLFKDRYEERSWVANIKVDFDKSKHLADSTIKKRAQEREKLVQKEREKDEAERRKHELEELKRSDELRRTEQEERVQEKLRKEQKQIKTQRRSKREERRRIQRVKKKFASEEDAMAHKIAVEERKLIEAQRKLESIRVLDELLDRVKTIKSKGSLKRIEEDLLKAAAKEAKGIGKAAASTLLSSSYKDQDEKKLRDKLVSKLKEKEVEKMKHLGQRLQSVKSARRGHGLEDDLSNGGPDDASDIDDSLEDISDDDLKLTTSTDEDEFAAKQNQKEKKLKKREKKDKKKRRKEKKEKRRQKDEERVAKKKRKDLDSHISLALKISEREKRSRSREKQRDAGDDRNGDGYARRHDTVGSRSHSDEHRDRSRSNARAGGEEGYPDYRARRAEERLQQRQKEREFVKQQTKQHEQAKEEMYDKMMNPHLYGDGGGGGGGYRRIKPGEHYEDVQRKELEHEIRVREKEERFRRQQQRERNERRELPPHRGFQHQPYPPRSHRVGPGGGGDRGAPPPQHGRSFRRMRD